MDRQAVVSRLIQSAAYDREKTILEVQFMPKKDGTPGAIWQYSDVLPDEAEGFFTAKSQGKFFLNKIKPNRIATKIEPPKPDGEKADEEKEQDKTQAAS
jgi:KTSC domain